MCNNFSTIKMFTIYIFSVFVYYWYVTNIFSCQKYYLQKNH